DQSIYFINTSVNWILQTYLRLKERDMPVELSETLPDEGIIVAFCGDLNFATPPTLKQFIISVSADSQPYPFANVHVVQNIFQERHLRHAAFIPHWPQPGLHPRDPQRGSIFSNVIYCGDLVNLDQNLQGKHWHDELSKRNLQFFVRDAADAHDFSD